MDRNIKKDRQIIKFRVALRKESVDRNIDPQNLSISIIQSLSARRAWIEIFCPPPQVKPVRGRSPQGERG